jgi:glycosyltransferase involved in cell wall biosynthesis
MDTKPFLKLIPYAKEMHSIMKPKLLVIPHIYAEDIRIRSIEFARRLTDYFEVYCLRWKDMLHVNDASLHRRRMKQLWAGLASLGHRFIIHKGQDRLIYLNAPLLQPLLLQKLFGFRAALRFSRAFNTYVLNYLIRLLGIDIILMASSMFYFPTVPGVRKFFDIVDWFPEDSVPPQILKETRDYLSYLTSHADGVFAVSDALAEKLGMEYGLQAIGLPNGADLHLLRSVPPKCIQEVRKRWGLADKFVIGYIGNHGPFTGIDFVLEMFAALHQQMKDASLFVVGPVDCWQDTITRAGLKDAVFTGPVAPTEISAYFHAIDIGVLAQDKSPGTEFAFQIKIVEYTACRKFVVATPLLVLQRLNWPNVLLAERRVNDWVKAITTAREMKWHPEWDDIVESYDWKALSRRLADYLLR